MKKKWFILILILVIVAVVLTIVFINLFKERDTKALSEKLIQVTETGYLSRTIEDEKQGSEENILIHDYLLHLKTLSGEFSDTPEIDQKEISKITNFEDALSAYEVVVEFFAREMIFAEATEIYTNNHKEIERLFDSAQKKADELEQYIKNLRNSTEGNEYWTARSWSDCYKNVTNMVNDTAKAVTKLSQIYQKSVPAVVDGKGCSNNALSDVIFAEMNNMLKNITSKANENAGYGDQLFDFVSAYLSKENESIILEYVFSDDLQEKARDLKENGSESKFYESFIAGQLISAK